MLDGSLPDGIRSEAGVALFQKLTPTERLEEFFRDLEQGDPQPGVTPTILVRDSPGPALARFGELLQRRPDLVMTSTFSYFRLAALRLASPQQKEDFARALRTAEASAADADVRARLRYAAEEFERSSEN
jgi:hypothetical protein